MVGPAGSVSDLVVVAAERGEVFDIRGSAFFPGDAMVEVAVGGRHPTTGENTGAVAGFDLASLAGIGPAAGDAIGDDLSGFGMCDSPPPFGSLLLFCDLAGEVGDDRSVSGEFAGVVGEPGQGFQVDLEVDGSPTGTPLLVPAF